MAQNPHIEDDQADDVKLTKIVSYLDGELDDTQMNEVEQDLIHDPDMRSHADILSRTWALLDSLDEVSASKQFTKETLTTIAAVAVTDDTAKRGTVFRRLATGLVRYKIIPCFLAGVIGGTAGLLISSKAVEKRQETGQRATTRIVLEDFDLLQNSERYLLVPELQSLQNLQLPQDPDAPSGSGKGDH